MPRSRIHLAALTRYDLEKDREHGGYDPVAPEDPGTVHAIGAWQRPPTGDPEILRHAEAVCGTTVKLLLPVEFDPGDPDACQRCAGTVFVERQRWPAAGRGPMD